MTRGILIYKKQCSNHSYVQDPYVQEFQTHYNLEIDFYIIHVWSPIHASWNLFVDLNSQEDIFVLMDHLSRTNLLLHIVAAKYKSWVTLLK